MAGAAVGVELPCIALRDKFLHLEWELETNGPSGPAAAIDATYDARPDDKTARPHVRRARE